MTRQKHVALIVIRRGPIFWLMTRIGLAAITMPWHRIYVLDAYQSRQDVLRHELVHIEQIERDGPVLFSLRYLWWLFRYGYFNNPYETEAYALEPIGEE